MNTKERMAERAKASKFFATLDRYERWELGDQLVLDGFDWLYWLGKKPSAVFLDELDTIRMAWEEAQ